MVWQLERQVCTSLQQHPSQKTKSNHSYVLIYVQKTSQQHDLNSTETSAQLNNSFSSDCIMLKCFFKVLLTKFLPKVQLPSAEKNLGKSLESIQYSGILVGPVLQRVWTEKSPVCSEWVGSEEGYKMSFFHSSGHTEELYSSDGPAYTI